MTAFELETDRLVKEDILRLLRFAEAQVEQAGRLSRTGAPCEQTLSRLLQSQRALRVARALVLREQFEQLLSDIRSDGCADTRCEGLKSLIEIYPFFVSSTIDKGNGYD